MTQPSTNSFPKTLREAIDTQQWSTIPQVIQNTLENPANRNANLMLTMASMLFDKNQPDYVIDLYLKALSFNPDLLQARSSHEQLANLYAKQGNFSQAKYHGDIAIRLSDEINQPYRPQKNLVAFSLYGGNPAYCETAILNAQAMPAVYPNWTMVVYHDDSVPNNILQRLANLEVELVNAKDINASHMPGTFWRFLALERDDVDAVIMRDADSVISEREKILVDEWLASDKPFHIIRDWYSHTDLILAGLWGARMGLLGRIRTWIEDYIRTTPQLHHTHADQFFLAKCVWGRIKPFAVHHSSVLDYPESTWLDTLPLWENDKNVKVLGSWETTNYKLDTQSDYLMMIKEGDKIICQYTMKQGQDLEIPRIYKTNITEGKWQLQFVPIQITVN